MKQLIYVPVIHGLDKLTIKKSTKKDKGMLNNLNKQLVTYYDYLSRDLINLSKKRFIDKVYVEGLFDFGDNSNLNKIDKYSPHWVAYILTQQGAILMPTEHPAFAIIKLILNHFPDGGINAYFELGKKPVDIVLSALFKTFKETEISSRWYTDLEELCIGEEIFDITKLRDKYIANNINKTLQEKENGVLIIGGGHKVDQYLKNINPKTEIFTFDKYKINLK